VGTVTQLREDQTWEGLTSPYLLGGYGADGGSGQLSPGVVASTPPANMEPWYSPDNPLFWVGLVIAFGTGLIYVSTHWKVGPAKGSITV
jgi:hypothetical protein